jgi:hypothetical protein
MMLATIKVIGKIGTGARTATTIENQTNQLDPSGPQAVRLTACNHSL